jgi:hypothetical protein
MPSQIITPPDVILSDRSVLLINALDNEVENLILFLRTIPQEYDIHLYHVEMFDDQDWVKNLVAKVKHIGLNYKYQRFIESWLAELVHQRADSTTSYGDDTPCPDLITLFTNLSNKN